MKILYAIQGTGNGHLARATEVVPLLKKMADTDVLVSGIQSDLELPFSVDYRLYGLSFIFGRKGGVNISETIRKSKLFRFLNDIKNVPVENYDLVINDFEPVSAWACKLKNIPCVGLSHQIAVLHPDAPRSRKQQWFGKLVLKKYAPVSANYGFHFKSIGENIFTPVIRSQIRQETNSNLGHYTVYLPAYGDKEIIHTLLPIKHIRWEVFSKHTNFGYRVNNIRMNAVSNDNFIQSLLSCEGILCSAGFETPAEALFLGKKICAIPMKNQYEQMCNAAFLDSMGVKVMNKLATQEISEWIKNPDTIQVFYPNHLKALLEKIISEHSGIYFQDFSDS